jgi:predicted ArsR family transcriptional regulator
MAGDNGSGRPQKVTTDDVLRELRSVDEPVGTAAELATELDVSSQTVVRRLEELEGREIVARKQVGANAVVWWIVAEENG